MNSRQSMMLLLNTVKLSKLILQQRITPLQLPRARMMKKSLRPLEMLLSPGLMSLKKKILYWPLIN
jgi:hypothetical protein